MKKAIHLMCVAVVVAALGYGTVSAGIVSWRASSGVLPSDSSIPQDARFQLSGNQGDLTLQDGVLTFVDTSSVEQLGINKLDIGSIPVGQDWAFQIELQMHSHSKPNLDFGASSGLEDDVRGARLLIASSWVGFSDYQGGLAGSASVTIDTTDQVHIFRAVRSGAVVDLFIDAFDVPALSIAYDVKGEVIV
jgi:hypothetical protein